MGQATSFMRGPAFCDGNELDQAGPRAAEPKLLPCRSRPVPWFDEDSVPQVGQIELFPGTNEMAPHLLQLRTDVPELIFPVLPELPWLVLVPFFPAFRSSSSCKLNFCSSTGLTNFNQRQCHLAALLGFITWIRNVQQAPTVSVRSMDKILNFPDQGGLPL